MCQASSSVQEHSFHSSWEDEFGQMVPGVMCVMKVKGHWAVGA